MSVGRRNVPGLTPVVAPSLDDQKTDQAVRNIAASIGQLQSLPSAGIRVVADKVLVDATPTTIRHPLGRVPLWVGVSCPRGAAGLTAGAVTEIRTGSNDRAEIIVLQADGYGAVVTVDVLVL